MIFEDSTNYDIVRDPVILNDIILERIPVIMRMKSETLSRKSGSL